MTMKHLRTMALAGTFVLGTAGLSFAAGSGAGSAAGSGAGSVSGSGSSSTHMNSNSSLNSTRGPGHPTGLERAETQGRATATAHKKTRKPFVREDLNTSEKNELRK